MTYANWTENVYFLSNLIYLLISVSLWLYRHKQDAFKSPTSVLRNLTAVLLFALLQKQRVEAF
jgi:hypothetical protein